MKPLTGRKVLVIGLIAFAVVTAANLVLAYHANRTFSGLVISNSYIASQEFNARTRAQEALGWTASLAHADDRLDLEFRNKAGQPVRPAALAVSIGRATTTEDDRVLDLAHTGAGYSAPAALAPGRWIVTIEATATDGTPWAQRHSLHVKRGS